VNPVRRRKLIGYVALVSVLGLAAGLILYALKQNVSLFYTPTQISQKAAPFSHLIRAGGMVEEKSIYRDKDPLIVHFKITDFSHSIDVVYKGTLPALFREGQGVVAQGFLLENNTFLAKEILAKHDENYMPPEIKGTLSARKIQHDS
jgi:cytochrome c-type biogenesis protein CcmE